MEDIKKLLGSRIRELRKKQKMSQEQLAEQTRKYLKVLLLRNGLITRLTKNS